MLKSLPNNGHCLWHYHSPVFTEDSCDKIYPGISPDMAMSSTIQSVYINTYIYRQRTYGTSVDTKVSRKNVPSLAKSRRTSWPISASNRHFPRIKTMHTKGMPRPHSILILRILNLFAENRIADR